MATVVKRTWFEGKAHTCLMYVYVSLTRQEHSSCVLGFYLLIVCVPSVVLWLLNECRFETNSY